MAGCAPAISLTIVQRRELSRLLGLQAAVLKCVSVWLQEAAALARGGFRQLMTFEYKWQVKIK